MTSKNLCFKLMKEDLKRRIWNMALLLLTLFFALVVPVIYTGGTPKNLDTDLAVWLERVTAGVLQMIGWRNPFIVMIVIVGAIVCGVSGFSYLHSARKVDFYHSIPVRREQLFLSSYLNGILMMAVPYLVSLLVAVVAASTFGVGLSVTFAVAMKGYFFHMAIYCLLYTTVVLAMVLTGHIIIALLGTAVFFSYGPMVIMLVLGYMRSWFKSFFYSGSMDDWVMALVNHTSPIAYYAEKFDKYPSESILAVVAVTLLVTAVLAAFTCFLYRIRPSEAAGRAMAFKKSMTPIKLLLVMPFAMAFCLFFYALRSTFAWGVFGVVCGVLLTHCLIEIIYHFDFRKLFTHKIHLFICMAAGILLLCGFKFDLFGYDSYLPKSSQVSTAAVSLNSMDNWVTYGDIKYDSRQDYYYWSYQDDEEYVMDHMALTDPSDVLYLAEQGIRYYEQKDSDAAGIGPYYYDVGYGDDTVRFSVRYTLKSGRKVARSYAARRADIKDAVQRIYDSAAYKEGAYPILGQTPEQTVRANLQQYDKVEAVPESVDVAALLKTYQEELKGLTYETRTKELPVATIQFITTDMDKALSARTRDSGNGYYYARDIADRCYYPVYPSFTGTLTLLEGAGMDAGRGLTAEMIDRINIHDYKQEVREDSEEDTYSVQEAGYYNITKKDEIESVIPALVYQDYYSMNPLFEFSQEIWSDVILTMEDEREISCLLDKDKLPSFLTERMEAGRQE